MRVWKCVLLVASFTAIFSVLEFGVAECKSIDGFRVKILPLPTFDKFPIPDSKSGEVKSYVGYKRHDFDPFYQLPGLAGVSPYLAIYPGSSVTFSFPSRSSFKFYWGTPDVFNSISFYSGGNLVGTLLGADFQQAYGFSEAHRPFPIGYEDLIRVESNVPFDTVVLSDSSGCCFEFSNVYPW